MSPPPLPSSSSKSRLPPPVPSKAASIKAAAKETTATKPAAPPRTLKSRSAIFAVGVAIIAGCGAIIGASLRQQTQQAAVAGRSPFSTFSSAQVIGSEAGAAGSDTVAAPAKKQAGTSEASKNDIAAQRTILETRRAGLVQQKLITVKKMEGLRERQKAREEREREKERQGLRKHGS